MSTRKSKKEPHVNVRYVWFTGFTEDFNVTPGAKSAESWYNHGMNLGAVIHIVIKNTAGEVLYEIKKDSPYIVEKKKPAPRKRKATKSTTKPKPKTPVKPKPKAPVKPKPKAPVKPKPKPKTPAKPRTSKKVKA